MQQTKRAIMESALNLFSQKGIYQTSLKDIAEDLNISKGTIFYHFPTKAELLYEIMDYGFSDALDKLFFSSIDVDKEGDKQFILSQCLSVLKGDNFLFAINIHLLEVAICGNQVILEKLQEKYRQWRRMFYNLIVSNSKEIDEEVLNAQASVILAIIDGLHVQHMLNPEFYNLKELSKQAAKAINAMVCCDVSHPGDIL
ncbi:MAG: TetR/AcrR family transcriptional regulator [Bacillota bacterium]|jgi:AcrR family transcriptional regulator